MNELMTISKLQTAKLAVREVRELDEIKRIADQAEALRGYAKAQKLSEDIQADVAEYALYAFRQLGVISADLEKSSGGRPEKTLPTNGIALSSARVKARID